MADELQPDQGQGQEGGTGIFDSYLQAVPEEHRDAVTGYLRDAEKNVNERIQKASELEKRWEPYQELELPPPDQLQELLSWSSQTLTSQETFDEWVAQQAQEKGWTPQQVEEDLAVDGELSPERIQQIAAEQLGPLERQLQELAAQQQTIVEERGTDLETQAIRDSLSALEKEAKVELSEDQRAMILDLGMPASKNEAGEDLPVTDTSWVQVGFDRFKQITSEGQKAFVEQASQQPASAMTTGGQPQLKPVTDWTEAKDVLRERWKQMQS